MFDCQVRKNAAMFYAGTGMHKLHYMYKNNITQSSTVFPRVNKSAQVSLLPPQSDTLTQLHDLHWTYLHYH